MKAPVFYPKASASHGSTPLIKDRACAFGFRDWQLRVETQILQPCGQNAPNEPEAPLCARSRSLIRDFVPSFDPDISPHPYTMTKS